MSDWRKWARIIVGVIIAVIVFSIFMNIVGDYRTAKQAQKRTEDVSTPATGPASSVTQTGRPPLNPPSTTSSPSSGKGAPVASKTKVVLVVVDGVNLRNGPTTTADIIRALKKNERLAYYATKNGYYQVGDKSGPTGWVSSNKDYTRLVAIQ
jgi:uncharacterized protein YgiM (DUF1202 family)